MSCKMVYSLEVSGELDKIFNKLIKKYKKQLESINKKIQHNYSYHNRKYKNLFVPLFNS